MIPERNLVSTSELCNDQQLLWVRSITDMMEEGPRILLRLKKFRQAIIGYPEPLLWYNKMMTETEMWWLESDNRQIQFFDANIIFILIDTFLQTCMKHLSEIQLEVWRRMIPEGSSVNDINVVETMLR
ncbi:hypothetical protein DPMN_027977 [Dreissena polymorpha]|uniref:Uncharacterized protein n=1 Tax=Dreissena polymorpha TaxID=45954 RepID=A0A9D4LUG4_DREPO|nr:hypothetical protein DPMN_027941 [Dreissena polymorpha]KAH3864944.1 hypothetical protein DPMN_027977 [Dreissena polymorpha]